MACLNKTKAREGGMRKYTHGGVQQHRSEAPETVAVPWLARKSPPEAQTPKVVS